MEIIVQLIALPLLAVTASLVLPSGRAVRAVVPLLIAIQLLAVIALCLPVFAPVPVILRAGTDLALGRMEAFFLILTTLVVAASLWHARLFFASEEKTAANYQQRHERLFFACAALFLLAMSFVFLCDNLGYLWIAIEGTTLASAPLVYFARTKHAIEATWKYFIICSVGIAFALLGTLFVFASSQHGAIAGGSLNLSQLLAHAPGLHYPLLRIGFVFCLLGYGTKAGIFPLHSWLPDAHSEAPAPASAMLSGALLNCALYAIWRVGQVVIAANHAVLVYDLACGLGTATAVAASLFLVRQHGIKRLWAYSSIENVGIMLVAIGFNAPGLFALQALNHSLAKVSLFLLSGSIIQSAGSKNLKEIRGLATVSPAWAMLLALAAVAVTGAPPFGTFISELLIMVRAADGHNWIVLILLSFALALSFIAVCVHVGRILVGTPKKSVLAPFRQVAGSVVPAALLVVLLLAGITSSAGQLVGGLTNEVAVKP